MRRFSLFWRIAPLAAVLCGSAAIATEGVDLVLAGLGAETFARYCATCHGAGGEGDGPTALALKTPPADLTRIAARREGQFPDSEIALFVDGRFAPAAHGSREMPVWGERFGANIPEAQLSEEIVRGQIAVLVEYLKSIQKDE
jgi:mono/diheme cytochrome c family protein